MRGNMGIIGIAITLFIFWQIVGTSTDEVL